MLLLFNISNKRKSASSDIQTLRSELKKQGAMEFFLTNFKGVWISDETLFQMFGTGSQRINNS